MQEEGLGEGDEHTRGVGVEEGCDDHNDHIFGALTPLNDAKGMRGEDLQTMGEVCGEVKTLKERLSKMEGQLDQTQDFVAKIYDMLKSGRGGSKGVAGSGSRKRKGGGGRGCKVVGSEEEKSEEESSEEGKPGKKKSHKKTGSRKRKCVGGGGGELVSSEEEESEEESSEEEKPRKSKSHKKIKRSDGRGEKVKSRVKRLKGWKAGKSLDKQERELLNDLVR